MDRKLLKIVPSTRRKDVFHLDFDTGETLTVTTAQIADYGLCTGKTLDDAEYGLLADSASLSRARSAALEALGRRPLSRREVTDKLNRKGVRSDLADRTADWLEEVGFLDDGEYACQIVRHYAGRGYGAARVREELYRRGVPREYWDDAMANMPDTGEIIDRLLKAKLKDGAADRRQRDKAAQSLLRRGYSWEEIRQAMDRLEMTEEWEEESE